MTATLHHRLAVIVASLLVGSLTSTTPARAATREGNAKVSYVGGGVAYLDKGRDAGLRDGAELDVIRRGKKAGTCVVQASSEHHATCIGRAVFRNDAVRFDPADVDETPRKEPRPLPEESTVALARARVQGAAMNKVVYAGPRRQGAALAALRGSVQLRQQAWSVVGHPDGTFARTTLDAGVQVPLAFVPGLVATSAVRVQGDLFGPANARFRPGERVQLYVWDAALSLRDGLVRGSLGRFRPTMAPGVTMLDGVQLGLAGFDDRMQGGVYAGLVPDVVSLVPGLSQLAAGTYVGGDAMPGDDVHVLPRARVGVTTTTDLSTWRGEAEAQVQLLYKNAISIGASSRVSLTPALAASWDNARIDVDVAANDNVRTRAAWRWIAPFDQAGNVDFDRKVDADATRLQEIRGAHHGDGGITWTISPSLALAADAGIAIDAPTSTLRGYGGPSIELPRLFGDVGGMTIGYQEEPGWLWGRSGYLQSVLRPSTDVSWSQRASYFEHAPGKQLSPLDAAREAAWSTWLSWSVVPWLGVQARAQALFELPSFDGTTTANATALSGELGVGGAL